MAGAAASQAINPGGRDFRPLELCALIFIVCTGFSSQMVMPLWIGAIIDDLGLSADAAGSVASTEFAAVAVVSLLVAALVHRMNARLTVILGLALLFAGNFLAAYAESGLWLTAFRVLTGIGKGLVVAIVFSLAAGAKHPTRAFALLNATYAVFSTAFYLMAPFFIEMGGAKGAFLMMAGVAVIGALFLVWFPNRSMAASEVRNLRIREIPLFGFLALAALIILWTGQASIWTFIERLGARLDLTVAQIGGVLSVAAFLTIGGPTLARVIDTRFGHTRPILAGVALLIATALALIYLPSAMVYSAMVPSFLILSLFIVPYVMGILSLADPAGRLAAASSAAMTAGGSLGALAGGWTIRELGYEGLAYTACGHFLVVIAITLVVAGHMRRRAAALPAV
ncbi:MAG TPA: MFS transporter [Sphingomonadales bacterium]